MSDWPSVETPANAICEPSGEKAGSAIWMNGAPRAVCTSSFLRRPSWMWGGRPSFTWWRKRWTWSLSPIPSCAENARIPFPSPMTPYSMGWRDSKPGTLSETSSTALRGLRTSTR